MSGRFVRASKFRHVHGDAARKDRCINQIRTVGTGEGTFIKGNSKFIAYAGVGGGGPVVILKREEGVRVDHNPPTVNVHKAGIMDFEFSPFLDNLIATGSEDGTIKVTVFDENGFKGTVEEPAASMEGHQKKISLLHFHPTADNVLGSCAFDNTIRVWDVQKQSEVFNYELPDLPTSFEWSYNGSQIGATCKDKTIRIYDPRKQNAAMTAPSFEGSKSARFVWLENHGKIAAIGFNTQSVRQYSIYDPRKFDAALATVDLDQSAGTVMPYYDTDTSILFMAGKGDGNIRYFEVVDEEPWVYFLSEFRSVEAHKGVTFLPKKACDTKCCEIAIALRLMKDYIEPVSFQVPRKSDLFQEDLFPDTYAGIAVMTAEEWLGGANKNPALATMKPGAQEAPKAAFKASKTVAQLEKELADANKRIQELEAELAKLKH